MKLVLIHGRSQGGNDPDKLLRQWEVALRRGLSSAGLEWPAGVRVAFPFYGDRLDELLSELDEPLDGKVMLRGAQRDSADASFPGELFSEMAKRLGIKDEEISKHYAGALHEKGVLNWEWVQAILKAIESSSPFGRETLRMFTRDVHAYLAYKAVQKAIDAIVSPHLAGEPCVVVGHSLGSIIGYNVLCDAAPEIKVERYVTLGSPLGMETIKRRLRTPLTMPSCARVWYNAMDDRDVVALYPLDEDNFPIQPPIVNNTKVENHTENRHGIAGYLDDPYVARSIHSALVGSI